MGHRGQGRQGFPRRTAVVFLIFLFLHFGAAPAGALTPTDAEAAMGAMIAALPGQQRTNLVYHPILNLVARARARDMAVRGYYGHTDPDGYGPDAAVKLAQYALPDAWGADRAANHVESITAAESTPEAALMSWVTSPAHADHLFGTHPFFAEQTWYGVGHVRAEGSLYKDYWVFVSAPPEPTAELDPCYELLFSNMPTAEIDRAVLGAGRFTLAWFGVFDGTAFPYIEHAQHGPMVWEGMSMSPATLETPDMGVLMTADWIYPFLWRAGDGAWLWYLKGSAGPRWFLNLSTWQWEHR